MTHALNAEDLALQQQVINGLKQIYDPEIPTNIYDLGLIYGVAVHQGSVDIQMTLTTPMCPVAQTFPQLVQDTVMQIAGVTRAAVELVWEPPWTPDNLSESVKLELGLL